VIECIGVCADGDNCLRYHCRACGRYWFGDAAHICGAEALDQRICRWMRQALDDVIAERDQRRRPPKEDEDVATCARNVLEQVKAAGLSEAFLDAYGPRLIEMLWRDCGGDNDDDGVAEHDDVVERHLGKPNGTNGVAKPTVAAGYGRRMTAQMVARNADINVRRSARALPREHQVASVAANGHAAKPGPRRVDVAQLATRTALLECLFRIGTRWFPLGDLNRRQCQVLQRQYAAAADAFGTLAEGLTKGHTVRQRWTAEQLEALVGDTLRGAAPTQPTW